MPHLNIPDNSTGLDVAQAVINELVNRFGLTFTLSMLANDCYNRQSNILDTDFQNQCVSDGNAIEEFAEYISFNYAKRKTWRVTGQKES